MQDGRFDTNSRFLLEYLLTFIYYSILRIDLVLDTLIDIPVIYLDVEVSLFSETCSAFLQNIRYENDNDELKSSGIIIHFNFCNDFIVLLNSPTEIYFPTLAYR